MFAAVLTLLIQLPQMTTRLQANDEVLLLEWEPRGRARPRVEEI